MKMIVTLKDEVSHEEAAALIDKHNLKSAEHLKYVGVITADADMAAAEALKDEPQVHSVVLDEVKRSQ